MLSVGLKVAARRHGACHGLITWAMAGHRSMQRSISPARCPGARWVCHRGCKTAIDMARSWRKPTSVVGPFATWKKGRVVCSGWVAATLLFFFFFFFFQFFFFHPLGTPQQALRAAEIKRRCGVQEPPKVDGVSTGSRPHHAAELPSRYRHPHLSGGLSGELGAVMDQHSHRPLKDNGSIPYRCFSICSVRAISGKAVAGEPIGTSITPAASSGFPPIATVMDMD